MNPAERAYKADIAEGGFQRGVTLGKWRIVSGSWPHPLIAIAAAARQGCPSEFVFRFDLVGYPERAPTSQIWNTETDQALEADLRPRGDENIRMAFRSDWQPALYIPCDRIALESHRQWQGKQGAWKPGDDITNYLHFVHDLLNSRGYTGTACAAA